MRKQHQTVFGDGRNGRPRGNCLATCIACLLDLSVSDVPNFVEDDSPNWFQAIYRFLDDHNFKYYGLLHGTKAIEYNIGIDGYYIVTGKSPRAGIDGYDEDMRHCVIFKNGKLFHDPHPEGSGLSSIENAYMIERIK